MASALAAVWSYCAAEEGRSSCCAAERQTFPNPEIEKMIRDRLYSEEVMEMRRRRIKPNVQPVEVNTLYNRRRGTADIGYASTPGYVVVELSAFDEQDESSLTVTSLASSTPSTSTPRTLERQFAL